MKNVQALVFVILFASIGHASGPQPTCIPPGIPANPISYQGLISGCSEISGGPPCLVGETVQFGLRSGTNLGSCLIVFTWDFPEQSVSAQVLPQDHEFQNAGTFTVTLAMEITGGFSTVHATQVVTVANASAIPMQSPRMTLIFLLSLTLAALYRLR
jgi:hypothetical protein